MGTSRLDADRKSTSHSFCTCRLHLLTYFKRKSHVWHFLCSEIWMFFLFLSGHKIHVFDVQYVNVVEVACFQSLVTVYFPSDPTRSRSTLTWGSKCGGFEHNILTTVQLAHSLQSAWRCRADELHACICEVKVWWRRWHVISTSQTWTRNRALRCMLMWSIQHIRQQWTSSIRCMLKTTENRWNGR